MVLIGSPSQFVMNERSPGWTNYRIVLMCTLLQTVFVHAMSFLMSAISFLQFLYETVSLWMKWTRQYNNLMSASDELEKQARKTSNLIALVYMTECQSYFVEEACCCCCFFNNSVPLRKWPNTFLFCPYILLYVSKLELPFSLRALAKQRCLYFHYFLNNSSRTPPYPLPLPFSPLHSNQEQPPTRDSTDLLLIAIPSQFFLLEVDEPTTTTTTHACGFFEYNFLVLF